MALSATAALHVFFVASLVISVVDAKDLGFVSFQDTIVIGRQVLIQWQGGVGGVYQLGLLMQQGAQNFKDLGLIATGITTTEYTWTPSNNLTSGSGYYLKLQDAEGSSIISSMFTLLPQNAAPSGTSPTSSSSGLSTASKVGLGVGLGLGIPLLAIIASAVVYLFRRERRKRKRAEAAVGPGASSVGGKEQVGSSAQPQQPLPGDYREGQQQGRHRGAELPGDPQRWEVDTANTNRAVEISQDPSRDVQGGSQSHEIGPGVHRIELKA